jgi:acyl carrier protein
MAVAAEPVAARPAPVAVATRPVSTNVAPKPVTAVNRLAAAPIPVARTAAPATLPEPAIQRNGTNGSHSHDVPAPHVLPAAPVARTAPAPAAGAAPAGHGIPSTEQFKEDLLQAVSERTGYPIEMLDLELPMESGLGIDSIKTVEIFSNLKTYHPYFRQEDQDEEEVLKEFTKLKTLGDIISAYDLRYQALTSGGSTGAKAADNGAAVERYTLEAVAAAPTSEKKTSLVSR